MLLLVTFVIFRKDAINTEQLAVKEAECFSGLSVMQTDLFYALISLRVDRIVGRLRHFGDLLRPKEWR